jgi:hypothetical protein
MKLPHLNPGKRWPVYAAGAGACFVVSLIVWFTVLSSALQQREARIARNNELIARRHKASEVATSLNTVRKKSATVEKALQQTAMRLEPATLVNDRLARLTDLANECGLSVDEVQPGQTTDGPHYQSVALKLAGSGSYPACARFLHRLHDAFPDTGVRAMDTSNNSPNPVVPVVSFRVDLVWYAAPLAPAVAPVAKTE